MAKQRSAESANRRFAEKFKKTDDRIKKAAGHEVISGLREIAPTTAPAEKPSMSWEEAIEKFKLEKQTLIRCEKVTLDKYLAHLHRFKSYIVNTSGTPRVYVTNIKREDISGFIRYLMEDEGLHENTINRYITSIKLFYNTLLKAGYIDYNPTAGVRKQSVAEKEFPSFTHGQVLKLLEQPDQKTWDGIRDTALLLMLADTGCRISEALFLTLSDIILDDDGRLVRVCFTNTKKKKEIRHVEISDNLRVALERWLAWRDHLSRRAAWTGDVERDRGYHKPLPGGKRSEYIFTNESGQMLSRNTWRDRLKKYCYLADIPEDLQWSSHTFRHSYGKIALDSGMDLTSVMKTMGHSTLSMVALYAQSVGKELGDKQRAFAPSMLKQGRNPRF